MSVLSGKKGNNRHGTEENDDTEVNEEKTFVYILLGGICFKKARFRSQALRDLK